MAKITDFSPDIKPYVINKAKDGKSAKVNLYGEIVNDVPRDWFTGEKISGLFIELSGFLKDLETLSEMDEVSFYINSVGGDLNAGKSIFNKIRTLKAETTTVVDSLAASAASIVAQAGDHRLVSLGSQTMIHCASTFLYGYYNTEALGKVERGLESADKSIAEILSERTGKTDKEILKMMKNETWMSAQEAIDEGFADGFANEEEEEEIKVDQIKNTGWYIINGIPHNFSNIPVPTFRNVNVIQRVSNGIEPSDIHYPNKEEKCMDIKELKENYPELCEKLRAEAEQAAQEKNKEATKNAVNEAIAAERARMQEIDSIAATVGEELVNEAKYGETPMTARDLAFKAMQEAQAKGASFLENRKKEQEISGVNDIAANPVGAMENPKTEDKDIEEGANLLNSFAK
jgi:ATP-dependent protease ClpP protease subunit